MVQFARSVTKWLIPLSYEEGVQYGKDVAKHAFSSLCALPPDPIPLFALVSALSSTLLACSNLLRGKIKGRDWALLIGTWSGLHAVMENRMQKELKKTVVELSGELSRMQEALKKIETMSQEENNKLEQIKSMASDLQATSEKITGTRKGMEKQMESLNESIQSSSQLIKQMKLAFSLIEGVGKCWEGNIERNAEVLKNREEILKAIQAELQETNQLQHQFEKGFSTRLQQLNERQGGHQDENPRK